MKQVEVDMDDIIWLDYTAVCDVEIDGHHIEFYDETYKTCDGNEYTIDMYTIGVYPTRWFSEINYDLFIGSKRYL